MKVMNKSGVSAVVATVLIVMITVAAVGLLWAIVAPFLKTNVADRTACVEAEMSIGLDQNSKYTCSSTEGTAVRVSRGSDENNWEAVQIIYTYVTGDSETVNYANPPNKNSEKVYRNNRTANVVKISVAPIVSGDADALFCSKTWELSSVRNCSSEVEASIDEVSETWDGDEGSGVLSISGISNIQMYNNESLSESFSISGEVSSVWVNNSAFGIVGEYNLVNTSTLSSGNYSLNISANNTDGDVDSEILNIEVLQSSVTCAIGELLYMNSLCLTDITGYWPLNNSLSDFGGSNYHSTCSACPTWSASRDAYVWDGADDYLTISVPNPASGTSVSGWVRVDSDRREDIWGDEASGQGTGLQHGESSFGGGSSGSRDFTSLLSSGSYRSEPSGFVPSIGQWYHVVQVYRPGNYSFYVDGVLVDLYAYTITQRSGSYWLGSSSGGSFNMVNLNGSIDQFIMFSDELTDLEVQELYNAGR
jgi:hypothetical protein